MRGTQILHVTTDSLRAAGVTDEQVEAFAKRFPKGATLTYQTLIATKWRVDWLAALVEWPRRMTVYQALDATCERFDLETAGAHESWLQRQRDFNRLAPDAEMPMSAEAWLPYKEAKGAAEIDYERTTTAAFERMHSAQAKIIAESLDHNREPVKWFPYESETFERLYLTSGATP